MIGRRRRYRRRSEEVELNLAAMLDMAFQLLAFFVLTFKPSPIEGQVLLHLPPAQAVTNVSGAPAGDDASANPLEGMTSLVISAYAAPDGSIGSMGLGDSNLADLGQLEGKLKPLLGDPNNPFDQIIIQASSSLRYEELMRIIDVCTRQSQNSGQKIAKLSFVELPEE